MRWIKKGIYFLAQRVYPIIAILIISFIILFIWFVLTGFSNDAGLIAIAIAAISAFFAFVSSTASLIQVVETQKQRENFERPYVIAYFESNSMGAFYFVIENVGNSPAEDLKIKFNPAPINHQDRPLNEISLFSNPITFLPAGNKIAQIIDSTFKFLERNEELSFKVHISYSSIYGKIIDEEIVHDLNYLPGTTLPRATIEDYMKKTSEQITDLVRTVKSAQGSKPFLVESYEENRARYRGMLEKNEDRSFLIIQLRKILEKILSFL